MATAIIPATTHPGPGIQAQAAAMAPAPKEATPATAPAKKAYLPTQVKLLLFNVSLEVAAK